MAVGVRSASSGSQIENQTDVTVTAPAGLTSGDVLVAVCFADNDDSTCVFTAPAGWSGVGTSSITALGGTAYGVAGVFAKLAGGSEPGSYAFNRTTATSWLGMIVHMVALTGAGTPNSPTFSSGVATTTPVAPATTGSSGDLLIVGFTSGSGSSFSYTAPTNMAEQGDTYNGTWRGGEIASEVLSSSGSTGTRTGSCTASLDYTSLSLTVPTSDVTERFAPDAILAQTGLTGAVTAIQDDPDSPDGSWLVG